MIGEGVLAADLKKAQLKAGVIEVAYEVVHTCETGHKVQEDDMASALT